MLSELIHSDIESNNTSRSKLQKHSSSQYYDIDHPVKVKEFEMPHDSHNTSFMGERNMSH